MGDDYIQSPFANTGESLFPSIHQRDSASKHRVQPTMASISKGPASTQKTDQSTHPHTIVGGLSSTK